jgi:hypothetical protein
MPGAQGARAAQKKTARGGHPGRREGGSTPWAWRESLGEDDEGD